MTINESSDDEFARNNYTISEDINGPVFAAAFAVETVLVLVPNLFIVVYTLYHYKVLKHPSMIFLTALAGSNLLVGVLFMPFTVITAAAGEWIFGRTDEQRDATCQFVGFIFAFGLSLIGNTIAIISLDRFLLIVKPFFYQKYMKVTTAIVLLVIAWAYSFIQVIPISFGVGMYALSVSTSSCIPVWAGHPDYVIFTFVLGLPTSFLVIITSVWTFCFTHKFIKRQKKQQSVSVPDQADNVYTKRVKKLFGLFGSLLLYFIVTNLAFVGSIIIGAILGFDNVPHPVYATAFIIFFSGGVANPIIQSLFRSDLKDAILNGLGKIKSCLTCCMTKKEKNKFDKHVVSTSTTSTTTVESNVTV